MKASLRNSRIYTRSSAREKKSVIHENEANVQSPSEHLENVQSSLSKYKPPMKKKLQSSKSERDHLQIQYDEVLDTSTKRTKWEPPDWRQALQNLREMRKNADAPVDSMGCHKCSDPNSPPEVERFQALIALMLSSQTKDQITHAAMQKLIEHGLTVSDVMQTEDEKLGALIYPVSFWKTKVKHIKKTAEVLRDKYKSDIPDTIEGLCELPGVGSKMAHLCMQTAWGKVTGIGVDTHVHRITNRLGWVKSTKTPEATRKELENWLPEDLWSEVNHLLVGFGQQTCTAIKPKCKTCLNVNICPFGKKHK